MLKVFASLAVSLSLATGMALADSSPYTPPSGGSAAQSMTVELMGTSLDKHACGKAVLTCTMKETGNSVSVMGQKLVPGGVYSLWLADSAHGKIVKEVRLDNPAHPVHAMKNGMLSFTSKLSFCPSGVYNEIVVRYHADKNARHVKKSEVALVGTVH